MSMIIIIQSHLFTLDNSLFQACYNLEQTVSSQDNFPTACLTTGLHVCYNSCISQ